MVEAEYSQITRQFTVQIRGLGLNKKIYIPMKFDTGAINTVISLKRLVCGKIHNSCQVGEYIENKRTVKSKTFFSASGHELTGYLCKAPNIEISGTVIKSFYYYIIIDCDREISLLGNDFISACDFNHHKFQNIQVSGFDEQAYMAGFENMESKSILTLDELAEIINGFNR